MTSGKCFEYKWFYMKYIYGNILVRKDIRPVNID
jgi:hypothetical protein